MIAVLVGAILFQLAFVASFIGAEARPVLREATIGLVGNPPAVADSVGGAGASTVSYQPFAGLAAARQAVRNGELPAALAVSGGHETLLVADAAGLTLTAAIEQEATAQAAAAHHSLAVVDVRPLPPDDPGGIGTFLLVLGWVIGSYLGMILLTRVLGPKAGGLRGTATLAVWAALYAVASAGLGVVLVDPLLDRITGHPWALLGAGSLIVFAVAMSTRALMSLFGMAGIAVAIVVFVVLGNPSAGGSVPNQMLTTGFRFLADVLPNHAGTSLLHGIQYYGGHRLGHPILVLSLYAVIATAVCFAQSYRRTRATVSSAVTATDLAAA